MCSFLPVWLPPPRSASTANVGGVNKDSKVEGTESEGLGDGGDGTEDLGPITLEGSTVSGELLSSVGCADSGTKGDCNFRGGNGKKATVYIKFKVVSLCSYKI